MLTSPPDICCHYWKICSKFLNFLNPPSLHVSAVFHSNILRKQILWEGFFLTLTQKLPLSNITYSTLCVCWCIENSQYLKFTGAAPVFSIKVRTSSYEHTNEWKGNSYVHNHENFSANKQQKLTMYVAHKIEPNMDSTTKWQRHLYSCTISTHVVPSPIVPTQFKAFSFKNSTHGQFKALVHNLLIYRTRKADSSSTSSKTFQQLVTRFHRTFDWLELNSKLCSALFSFSKKFKNSLGIL